MHTSTRAACSLVFRAEYALIGAALIVACNSKAHPTTATPGQTVPPRIVVLGDSLAVSPSRADSFPSLLQARLDGQGLEWEVSNAGVSGDTTADGLRRLDGALIERTRVLVVALGANDGLQGIRVSTAEANLSTIIERAQQRGIRVLLCGMEAPPLHGLEYTLAFHRIFPRLAAKHDVPLVPFLLEGVVLNPSLNGDDLIHPNASGARRIADTVWPYLRPLLREDNSGVMGAVSGEIVQPGPRS